MFQKPPRQAYATPHIDLDGHQLNAVEHFSYLGSVTSNDAINEAAGAVPPEMPAIHHGYPASGLCHQRGSPIEIRWAGHVSRMDNSRMPKAIVNGELHQGKHDRWAPRKRFKDQLNKVCLFVYLFFEHS